MGISFRTAAAALFLLAMAACDLLERENAKTAKGAREENGDTLRGAAVDTVLYAAGIEYPEGYGWREDPDYGSISGTIVVFAGQKRILEIPAGPGTSMPMDPKCHKLYKGHLYSAAASGGGTVISRDGDKLFSYTGEETLEGILTDGDDLYTLGRPPGGAGFCYRKNGEVLLESGDGTIVGDMENSFEESGALFEDGGLRYFTYLKKNGNTSRYMMARDGVPEEIPQESGVTGIRDARLFDGELHLTAQTSHSFGRILYMHDSETAGPAGGISPVAAHTTNYGRLASSGGKIFIKEHYSLANGTLPATVLWSTDRKIMIKGEDIRDFWLDDGAVSWLTTDGNSIIGQISAGGKKNTLPDESKLMSKEGVVYKYGVFYVAALPLQKELSPFVWRNGDQLAYALNGYIFDLSVLP